MFYLLAAALCTFLPPSEWEIAQLKTPSPYIQVGFLGKGTTTFRPSISLAIEEVDVSLKEYVKAVKEIHQGDPLAQWRDLGKFVTQAGVGRLTEISTSSAWGEIKTLQAIVVKEKTAYILTAAVLKKEFSLFQEQILGSFRSMVLIPDIWSPITDSAKKEGLRALFASLGQSQDKEAEKKRLQEEIASYTALGPHWQFLALREGLAKIGK